MSGPEPRGQAQVAALVRATQQNPQVTRQILGFEAKRLTNAATQAGQRGSSDYAVLELLAALITSAYTAIGGQRPYPSTAGTSTANQVAYFKRVLSNLQSTRGEETTRLQSYLQARIRQLQQ